MGMTTWAFIHWAAFAAEGDEKKKLRGTRTTNIAAAAANAGGAQNLCGVSTTNFTANSATNNGTGTWSVLSGYIWLENFDDLADGTTSDAGATAWTRTRSGSGYSEVRSQQYKMTRNTTVWTSESIDISGMTDVGIIADLSSYATGKASCTRTIGPMTG